MNKVEAFITSVPLMKALMREDMMITVFDHEKYLYYSPSEELNFGHKPGDPLPNNYLNYAMVNQQGTTVVHVPADEFGVPFDSISIPIKDDNGEMIGAINAAVSTRKKDALIEIISSVEGIANELQGRVEEIALNAESLTEKSTHMQNQTQSTVEYSSNIQDIAATIKNISDQTNLLGLNASIEAARVGAAGAGFGVVAEEIRKLSSNSKEATGRIEDTLKSITNSLVALQAEYDTIADSSQKEMNLVQDFITQVEELKTTSDKLRDFMKDSVID
ncbi:methyl-accepting chemotaxis protein [Gracilibacillus sp. S3-1-1]|uniref:Methyl-accepting chemotaxis protein n=1 Tax=Gracilibacillus pellucidus TaxID=3095368 RepID=A0ACC6M0J3_9BACI|nr:methyl-accepting chemotaxis protein [Gracilibacillus sp. S3-1-1]MDX8044455.1 methyl-accepting chemotaxis protein [Gracilibacillus sp. S3-1-1]